jgi:hypothetical protein
MRTIGDSLILAAKKTPVTVTFERVFGGDYLLLTAKSGEPAGWTETRRVTLPTTSRGHDKALRELKAAFSAFADEVLK